MLSVFYVIDFRRADYDKAKKHCEMAKREYSQVGCLQGLASCLLLKAHILYKYEEDDNEKDKAQLAYSLAASTQKLIEESIEYINQMLSFKRDQKAKEIVDILEIIWRKNEHLDIEEDEEIYEFVVQSIFIFKVVSIKEQQSIQNDINRRETNDMLNGYQTEKQLEDYAEDLENKINNLICVYDKRAMRKSSCIHDSKFSVSLLANNREGNLGKSSFSSTMIPEVSRTSEATYNKAECLKNKLEMIRKKKMEVSNLDEIQDKSSEDFDIYNCDLDSMSDDEAEVVNGKLCLQLQGIP